jgi:hypothetical protein
MVTNPKTECLRRAAWYLNRIRALQRELTSKAVLDSDDVEQCQAMLREIRARFRADQRMPPRGQLLSEVETSFRSMLAVANDALRIPAGSRPVGRWRVLLAECQQHIDQFSTQNLAPVSS